MNSARGPLILTQEKKKKNGSRRWVSLSSSHSFLSSASARARWHYLTQIKCWHDAICVDGAQRAQVPGEPSHPLSVPDYLRSCLSRYLCFVGYPCSNSIAPHRRTTPSFSFI